jgi:hypothetical protein
VFSGEVKGFWEKGWTRRRYEMVDGVMEMMLMRKRANLIRT